MNPARISSCESTGYMDTELILLAIDKKDGKDLRMILSGGV